MQGGDISNEVAPRLIVVYEGLLGTLTSENELLVKGLLRFRRYQRAAQCWDISADIVSWMWDVTWRKDTHIDLYTYLRPFRYGGAIKDRLDALNVPYGNFTMTTPDTLAKQMAYMPYVAAVFYREPQRLFAFGSRGVYVRSFRDMTDER